MKKLTKSIFAIVPALVLTAACFTSCENLVEETCIEPSSWSEGKKITSAYVMASIGTTKTKASDSLHLSVSADGLTWTAVNGFASVHESTIGTGHIREPYIFRKNDGTFVLLARDCSGWGLQNEPGHIYDITYNSTESQYIYVAFSEDLITWKNEHLLKVTSSKWDVSAPRAMYNKAGKCYDIYWTGRNNDGVYGIYTTQTYDFITTKDETNSALFTPSYSVSAGYAVRSGMDYFMVYRDELVSPETGKGLDIQIAKMENWGEHFNSLTGRYEYINRLTDQSQVIGTELPCLYQLEDGKTWILLAKKTQNLGTYTILGTSDLSDPSSWVDYSSAVTLNSSSEDATVTRITEKEYKALVNY
ncbi:MAG: hypothetical protein SO116_06010 [Treponema sp.]|nr:hypothetical protein [Treponema sp.]